jgi:hypothetical protein
MNSSEEQSVAHARSHRAAGMIAVIEDQFSDT